MVQTRTSDWIGANCRNAESFQPLARRATALHVGDVYYIDLANGSDGNDGENWQKAFKTFNYAIDQGTAYNNDYFLVKGWLTETGTGVVADLDVAYQHFIGAAGIMNPIFPEKGSLYRSGAGDAPYVEIAGEFIEFGGFAVNAAQSSGTESSTVSKGAVRVGNYAEDGPAKAFLHNIDLPDWNTAASTTGLTIVGSHHGVIDTLTVDGIYGNFDVGIYCTGGANANPESWHMQNLWFKGDVAGAFATGIKLQSDPSDLQNSLIEHVRHNRGTNIFNLGAAASGYCMVNDAIGDMTLGNIFTGGSDCSAQDDMWTNYKWSAFNCFGRDGAYAATD